MCCSNNDNQNSFSPRFTSCINHTLELEALWMICGVWWFARSIRDVIALVINWQLQYMRNTVVRVVCPVRLIHCDLVGVPASQRMHKLLEQVSVDTGRVMFAFLLNEACGWLIMNCAIRGYCTVFFLQCAHICPVIFDNYGLSNPRGKFIA